MTVTADRPASRISESDPRLWLNGREIADALGRSPSTVYDALERLRPVYRTVGNENRFPWKYCLELASRWAVPTREVGVRLYFVFQRRAEELDADPRDVASLFDHVCRAWIETRHSGVPDVSSDPRRR